MFGRAAPKLILKLFLYNGLGALRHMLQRCRSPFMAEEHIAFRYRDAARFSLQRRSAPNPL